MLYMWVFVVSDSECLVCLSDSSNELIDYIMFAAQQIQAKNYQWESRHSNHNCLQVGRDTPFLLTPCSQFSYVDTFGYARNDIMF